MIFGCLLTASLLASLVPSPPPAAPPTILRAALPAGEIRFGEVTTGLPGAWAGKASWLDADSDGDLDIIVAGWNDTTYLTKLFLNSRGSFTESPAAFVPLGTQHALAVGDYDNDGDLDIATAGRKDTNDNEILAKIYRNDHGRFVDIHAPIDGAVGGPATWIDYDGDGDLDVLVGGSPDVGLTLATRLYRNDDGAFVPSGIALPGLLASSAAWGDIDKDGDSDLFLMGYNGAAAVTSLYRNDDGIFVDTGMPFESAHSGDCAFVDFDNDGDPDISYTGTSRFGATTKLYRNDSARAFTDIPQAWTRVWVSALAWADIDGDGDMDFAESGRDPLAPRGITTRIFRNDAGTFADLGLDLPGVWGGSLSWGDFDDDGAPDLLLTGGTNPSPHTLRSGPYQPVTKLFRNLRVRQGMPHVGDAAPGR